MRTLVRQQSTAALAAVCLAVPAVITATQAPAPKIDSQVASHLAPVRTDNVALAAVSLLDALGLPLEAALWITTANPGGLTNAKYTTQASIPPPPLPGALTSDPTGTYTSLYTVINNGIKIISAPATDLTTGQFDKIVADTQAAITTFNTSLQGFPVSVAATIGYVGDQLGGSTAAFTTLKVNTTTPSDPGSNVKTTLTTPKLKKGSSSPGGFLSQLQGAVDKQLGGGSGVKVASKSAADPGSNPFSGKHGLGAFGQKNAKSGDDGATAKPHFGFAKKDHKKDSSATD